MKALALLAALALPIAPAASCAAAAAVPASAARSLVIGDTFTIDSAILGETRRINVVAPRLAGDAPLPLMLMPDGGLDEDLLHVAGLLQVGAGNGSVRPFLLAGIENTERRRDLTGPTDNPKDRAIAPRVGGSAAFRAFIKQELLPELARRYRLTGERAIIGESLAGLFVVETLVQAPDLFDTYIAIDPSLWWNDGALLAALARKPPAFVSGSGSSSGKRLYIASSADAVGLRGDEGVLLAAALRDAPGLSVTQRSWREERHGTIYHPAALAALRALLAPPPASPALPP